MSNINPTHLKVSDRLMLGLLTIFASLILISSFTNLGPVYLSDEVHYAAKAAHLAGQSNLLSSSWHAGYSLTLVPIFKLFGIQKTTWVAVTAFNLILLLGSIGFWFSSLQHFGISKTKSLLLSISSLVCFSVWGFTAWMFVNPWMQLIIAMMSRWLLIKHFYRQLFAITITSAFAYWIHPTGLLIAASAWLIVIANLASNKQRSQLKSIGSILFGLLITGLLVLLYQAIHSKINISMGGDGGHYGKQISSYLFEFQQDTTQTFAEVSTALINGIANISIATYGYGILFFAGLTEFRRTELTQARQSQLKIFAFITLSTIALLLFSSLLAINEAEQYQHMLHQRYFAPIIQALWILGLSQWLNHENRGNLPLRLTLTISPVLGALIIGSVFWDYNKRFSIIDTMSSGSSLFSNALNSEHEALAGLAIGSVLIIVVQIMAWRPKLVIAGVISSVAGWTMNQTRANVLSGGSGRPVLINEIKRVSKDNNICLAAIPTRLISGQSNNLYELYLSSPNIQRLVHKRETYQEYNNFFDPDVRLCEYIVAPLDLHLTRDRKDLEPINRQLNRCQLNHVDDRYGWGLYQCSGHAESGQQLSPAGFRLASTGTWVQALPAGIRPLRVFSDQAFSHEKNWINYATLINKDGRVKIRPCESIQSKHSKNKCNQNKTIKIAKAGDTPLYWGLYLNNLEPGNHQLLISDFKVYKGRVTIEVIDERLHQIKKKDFSTTTRNATVPFQIHSDQKQIEIRIMATKDSQFSLPTYFVITS